MRRKSQDGNARSNITVGLYLRGDDLDPALVSKVLGMSPSRSQRKGEKRVTSTNKEYTTRIGLWALFSETDSNVLSDHFAQLVLKLGTNGDTLRNIPGVEEAYFDVFMARTADEDGGGTFEFDFDAEQLAAISNFGISIKFEIAVVRE